MPRRAPDCHRVTASTRRFEAVWTGPVPELYGARGKMRGLALGDIALVSGRGRPGAVSSFRRPYLSGAVAGPPACPPCLDRVPQPWEALRRSPDARGSLRCRPLGRLHGLHSGGKQPEVRSAVGMSCRVPVTRGKHEFATRHRRDILPDPAVGGVSGLALGISIYCLSGEGR
jgi:hypothetical protein